MSSLFGRRSTRTADWRIADLENLYSPWVASASEITSRLASHPAFTSAEIATATLWSARQHAWGLKADLRRNDDGEFVVLEVFGPDDLVPHCILYPAEDGIQVDEFSGDSRIYACLETALQEIAPLF